MPVDPARAKSLFLAAADLPAADRGPFLGRECGADADLRDRVEALLRADEEPPVPSDVTTSPFDPGPAPDGGTVRSDGPPAHFHYVPPIGPGAVIADRYTLLKVIGEGGMGSVFLASQTEPVKRQLALKLIKTGMDSKAVLARFDAERQALALMDHPNIARIYDGGLTPTGQPFFVMELVTGVPLTDYCDTHRLMVDARLRLFVAVCQAVQHAHQKGIIHRDLKPGNVLVTEVDGRPTPKVIDFGVAKATGQQLTDLSLSETGAIVGTPAYMSPEQADPTSMDIDTRTDVYALGVMLYELLAGSPPLDAAQFRRGALLEMLRMVREVEPPRPSTRLSTADALPNIAAARSIDPARLAKLLRGELDWVVMKALEKDRTRRYESATAFARDIERYLADEVVEARPPSRGYRLKKFVTRNKVQVLAGSLVLLTLVAGVVASTYFAVQAREEASAARAAEIKAEAEAKAARKAEGEARTAEGDARSAETKAEAEAKAARKAEADAKWQARLANDARHAIQIDLALRAREEKDYERVAALLQEVRPEYQGVWETRYVRTLWRRETPLLATLKGHTSFVRSASFGPDGTRVVTASEDGTARVWDAATGREQAVLKGHTSFVRSASFSPDGTRVVTASEDGTARVWDAATGREQAVLKGRTSTVESASFSPDGTRVVTASLDKTARVWDAATGREQAVLKGHTDLVVSASFSPDGTRVVTASLDGTARVWDAATGREQAVLKGHTNVVYSAAFSPDGTRVVTASGDGTARVWDAATGQEKAVLKGHTGGVWSVAFSPDGTRVVTASQDKTARVWDAEPGLEMRPAERPRPPLPVAPPPREKK
ncbi:WD40 repeat domain-containing serine/threonine protein kinase [Frigoriglobus tundricola]|uniref:Serine/threonine protein kinase n=1 Tax=Frigoriglobus tundricola TaxID=2774151 RepID=A0A6M5YKF4_9BACT|nr:serine/threonine-protein kinase [Frigoriglobus tundricola]QJW93766.1 Serine/threonine protein kinase [Frigoriglobus tundricola]